MADPRLNRTFTCLTFLLLEGNPLENISAVRKPVAVFKGDRWFDPAQLHEAIGIKPFTR